MLQRLAFISMLFLIGSAFQAETVSLFNGVDLSNWEADVPAVDEDPSVAPSFIVRDGLLVSLGEPRGHLITKRSFSNYRLEVEYRFTGENGDRQ